MARMTSFAGEFEIKFLRAHKVGEQLVIEAEMGVWDSQIYFRPQDVLQMIRLLLNPSALSFFLVAPYVGIRNLRASPRTAHDVPPDRDG